MERWNEWNGWNGMECRICDCPLPPMPYNLTTNGLTLDGWNIGMEYGMKNQESIYILYILYILYTYYYYTNTFFLYIFHSKIPRKKDKTV